MYGLNFSDVSQLVHHLGIGISQWCWEDAEQLPLWGIHAYLFGSVLVPDLNIFITCSLSTFHV